MRNRAARVTSRPIAAWLDACVAATLAVTALAAPCAHASGNDAQTRAVLPRLMGTLDTLGQHGVTFWGFLQLDASHVLAGGLPDAPAFDGQYLLDLNLTVDTRSLLGWPGGTVFVDFQSHAGPNVATHQVPVLADADNMDAGTTNSIDRAWYQQDFFGQKVRWLVGLMYVDDRFFTVPYGSNFVSLDFSSDASISTFVLPTYPKGAWGSELWVYPNAHLYSSLGAFSDHATELAYDPGGQLILSEEGWQGSWRGLPYKLQLGAWTDTGAFRRFRGGITHHASGVYLVASDKLWQPAGSSERGIGMFVQLGAAPPSVAAVRRHFGLGLVWTGPAAARPRDELGIAFSDSFLTPQSRFAYPFESEIEAYYQVDAAHGWTIQPDLGFWRHPSGGTTPDTLLGLVRVTYSF